MVEPVVFGHWSLLPTVGDLSYDGTVIGRLRKAEERILLVLLDRHPGAYQEWQLCDICGFELLATVRVHISNLRKRICRELIEHVGYGRGYRVNPEATP